MRLLDLLVGGTQTSLRRLGMMAAVAGGSNAGLLAVVNRAAEQMKEGRPQLSSVVLFLICLFAYAYSQRYVMLVTSAEVESLLHRYRERLLQLLKRCELQEVEHIGRGRIYSAVSTDTQTISQMASGLVMGVQAAILILCASVYLATISMTSLILSALFLTVATRIYLRKMTGVNEVLHLASEEESGLHDLVNGLLDGFKEIKLSSERATAVLSDVVRVSRRTADFRMHAQQKLTANVIFGQLSFMMLLGTLVFLTPMFGHAATVTESMTTVVFLIGPISALVVTVPQIAVANAAAENLHTLEQVLKGSIRDNGDAANAAGMPLPAGFHKLELRKVFFRHATDDSEFALGPVDLTVHAGEVVFVTGGNGSGKSTLIKLMTGLYAPVSGELLLNDVPVDAKSGQAFRDRFAAVFYDFHLFRKFYGLRRPGPGVAEAWLEELEIADKTHVVADGFSTIALSAGQKKRLALLTALLEDKPIIVLDEWAADQDPHFRRKFYDVLLPRLKAEGKTVIAVTHDDRYFYVADRRFHMEEGRLRDMTEKPVHG